MKKLIKWNEEDVNKLKELSIDYSVANNNLII